MRLAIHGLKPVSIRMSNSGAHILGVSCCFALTSLLVACEGSHRQVDVQAEDTTKAPIAVESKAPPAPGCKVNDVDIAGSYSGECRDGLAHGKGIAKGRDVYEGEFVKGNAQGHGVYAWGANTEWATERWEGFFYKGKRTGFGAYSVEVGSKNSDYYQQNGVREGNRYVVRGVWGDGNLVVKCPSESVCLKAIKLPALPLAKKKELANQSDRLIARNSIERVFLDPSVQMSKAGCFFSNWLDLFVDRHPGKSLLNANELLELFTMMENKSLAFAILADCPSKSDNAATLRVVDDYQSVDIDELKVDISNLVPDQKIRVRGVGMHMMNVLVIKRDAADPSFIMVDTKLLPRDQKINVIKECSKNIIMGCSITISGTNGNVMTDVGILAEKVEFEKTDQR